MNGATRREDENQGELFAETPAPWGFTSATRPATPGCNSETKSAVFGPTTPTPAPKAGMDRTTFAIFMAPAVGRLREQIKPSKKYGGLARARGEGPPPTAIDFERGGEIVAHLNLATADGRKFYGIDRRSPIGLIRGTATLTADGWLATAQNGIGRDFKRGRP